MDEGMVIYVPDDSLDTYADYFAIKLEEEFPGIDFEVMETDEERRGWNILFPSWFTDEKREALTAGVRELRDSLFYEKDCLIAYTISEQKKGRRR